MSDAPAGRDSHALRRAGPGAAALWGLALLLAVLLAAAAWGALSDSEVEAEARRIYTTVMSPYCAGLMLADCTSSAAAELRDQIRQQLAAGVSPDEIRQELVAAFGEDILALPPSHGAGLLAWLAPICGLAAGLAILFWWVRQRQLGGAPAPAAPAPAPLAARPARPAGDLRARLEDELRDYE